jgi:hypothetical protein
VVNEPEPLEIYKTLYVKAPNGVFNVNVYHPGTIAGEIIYPIVNNDKYYLLAKFNNSLKTIEVYDSKSLVSVDLQPDEEFLLVPNTTSLYLSYVENTYAPRTVKGSRVGLDYVIPEPSPKPRSISNLFGFIKS